MNMFTEKNRPFLKQILDLHFKNLKQKTKSLQPIIKFWNS